MGGRLLSTLLGVQMTTTVKTTFAGGVNPFQTCQAIGGTHQEKLIFLLRRKGGMLLREMAEELGWSKQTAKNHIAQLVEKGVVVKSGRVNNTTIYDLKKAHHDQSTQSASDNALHALG